MNTVVVEVRVRRDGRRYPVTWKLPDKERGRAIRLVHELVPGRGMSIRAAQRVMLADHAVRRSVGQLHNDLHGFTCSRCEDEL
jgi:hypothetical protein